MNIKTMIVALGISFVMLGSSVFSSEGYLGLQATKGADGTLVVKRVVSGSVASYAGLKPKDRILKIDDVDLNGLSFEKSKSLLKGEAGKSVKILVNQNGKLKEMKLVRTFNKNGIIPIRQTPNAKNSIKKAKANTQKAKITKNITNPNYEYINSYGFLCFKEPYNKKVLVFKVIPDSPADRAGIKSGFEIIRINDLRVRNRDFNTLTAEDSATFYIRTNNRKKVHISLKKEIVGYPQETTDELLNIYWKQINPTQYENIHQINADIYNKMSGRGKQEARDLNYWYDKKIKFYGGYKSCTMNANNYDFIHSCLADLVAATKAELKHEQDLAHERAMMKMYTGAINNYAYALMNQNVNVNYSGTINHNVNHSGFINMFGNFNVNHRGWIFHY